MLKTNKIKQAGEILNNIEKCTNCGKCKEICPIYQAAKEETKSPRGILTILRLFLEEKQRINIEDILIALKECNQCFACQNICPAGVNFSEILLDFYGRYFKYIGESNKYLEKTFWRKAILNREKLQNFKLLLKIIQFFKLERFLFDNFFWFANIKMRSHVLSNHTEYESPSNILSKDKECRSFFLGEFSEFFFNKTASNIIEEILHFKDEVFIPYEQVNSGAHAFFKGDIYSFIEAAKANLNSFAHGGSKKNVICADTTDMFLWNFGYNYLLKNEMVEFENIPKAQLFIEYLMEKKFYITQEVLENYAYIIDSYEYYFLDLKDKLKDYFGKYENLKIEIVLNENRPFSINLLKTIYENKSLKQDAAIEKYFAELNKTTYEGFITSSLSLIFYNKYIAKNKLPNLRHIADFIGAKILT